MAAHSFANGHLEEDSSDPMTFYAQVLVEARTHVATAHSHQQWYYASPPRPHPQARHDDRPRGLKSWANKLLSLLKRPKKRHEAKVIPVQDTTTKVRTSKYKSAPQQQPGRHRQQSSGPLYTDGTPLTPTRRSNKPKSGPLTPFELPDAALSPYLPLRRPSNCRLHSGPVYLS